MENKKLKGAILGGGSGSYIGKLHMFAAQLENEAEIVAGIFSHDQEKCRKRGNELGIDPKRVYASLDELIDSETQLSEGERIDFVINALPNNQHAPESIQLLNAGFHVISDKPAGTTFKETSVLKEAVESSGMVYALTYGYTGYPMVVEARNRVSAGELGDIERIVVEYSQDWLARLLARSNGKAPWRTDPEVAGISCCLMDIGTHAENLISVLL